MNAEPEAPLIRALLAQSECYDHPVGEVRLIETHISWVLLAGDYAYKIKKPVDLGFLDFSTLELRRQACGEEVRLNRRLAPDYYLGVVAITGSPDAPHLGGSDEPFEYAVQMRRFPPEDALDQLAQRGELDAEMIDRLAARVARFHRDECAVASADASWGEPDMIARPVAENFRLLAERLPDQALLKQLQDWGEAEQRRLTPAMLARKRAGFVRECHGDLHLGNLAWVDGELLIFDCIEFSPALRWIDVISEVAFCYMDMLHRGQNELAMRFLNAWLEATGDYEGVALLRYYAVYRAMVRAKVAALRAGQAGGEAELAEVDACLRLAERLMQGEPPQLWITHGLSGSGKTTQTQSLLQRQGMIRLRSDIERKRLAGLDALARGGAGEGLYTQQAGERTYRHLAHLAEKLLDAGWPALVDAASLQRWQRDLFRDLARRHGAEFRILDMQADPAVLRERISQRTEQGTDASDADLGILQHQLETAQPLAPDEMAYVVAVRG
ncbi:MAG: aminoglycoside phosphotransferase [Gallionellales bacterium GWA2_60_142]|nr:MAG: aminoglycoside phosphotransferase [Gallionellales bacterium GWA2_60_142]HCI12956.1 aminoglycoside phosphotransferase [Gallionellaceae bacterium]